MQYKIGVSVKQIFNYTSYRDFLADFYKEQKDLHPYFTYRYIAAKVGFKSAGHFTRILKGDINLSNDMITLFISFLNLKGKEAEYFELLVRFNQAPGIVEKKRYLERMTGFRSLGVKVVDADCYELYQKWYYNAVRDALCFYPFSGNFTELARILEPVITPAQARKSIALLERLKLIRCDADGVYRQNDALLSSGGETGSISLVNFAVEMLDRAKAAAQDQPKDQRHIGGAGFSASPQTFELIQDEIRACKQRILALAKADTKPSRVYHMNISVFPLSKSYETKQGSTL